MCIVVDNPRHETGYHRHLADMCGFVVRGHAGSSRLDSRSVRTARERSSACNLSLQTDLDLDSER